MANSDYEVRWEIDAFDMAGPIQAALHAQHMQQKARVGYNVGVFIVTDADGRQFKVDLDEAKAEAILL